MALRKVDTQEQYAQLLIKDRNELNELYEDIFIHVTGFFRDPESIQALQHSCLCENSVKRGSSPHPSMGARLLQRRRGLHNCDAVGRASG